MESTARAALAHRQILSCQDAAILSLSFQATTAQRCTCCSILDGRYATPVFASQFAPCTTASKPSSGQPGKRRASC